MRNFIFALAAVTILFGTQVRAAGIAPGVVFNPSFFYYSDKDDNNGTSSTTTRDIINLKFGYLMAEGIYLGFVYDIDNKSVNNGTTTTNNDRKSYGGTIGYLYNGWQFLASYFLSSELDIGSTNYKGTGWAAEVGYIFDIGSVGLGPLISYRNWSYNKDQNGSISPNRTQSNILPSLQIFMSF